MDEWHDQNILDKIGNLSWSKSIFSLHKKEIKDFNSQHYRRLAYDEILSNLLVLSQARTRVKKLKKEKKNFNNILSKKIKNNFSFSLTAEQIKALDDINFDLKSNYKMFRILQGDVGTGKTIVSLLAAANVISSGYQCALMAPTEILAKQHFDLAKKIFNSTNINIQYLVGKTKSSEKK